MQQLQVFQFDHEQIRTVAKDGAPWFFAQDVAQVLGYSATSAMLKRLDEDEQMIETFLDGTTYKKQTLITESGLYNAVLGSHLGSAKRFKKWVTSEVLPAIRKTGGYSVDTPELMMAKGLIAAQKLIEQKDATIAELAPKAAVADRIASSEGMVSLRDAAKALKLQQSRFINWLLLNGWLYRDMKGKLRGYSSKTPRYINHKTTPIPVDGDEDRISMQAMVTAEGLIKLAGIFNVEVSRAA